MLSTSMRYFVTHFDHAKAGNYRPILDRFLVAAATLGHRVAIITDDPTARRHNLPGQVLIVNPRPFSAFVREGNHFDYKSALICAAVPLLPADSVVMDSDAIMQRDPSEALHIYAGQPFAMPPDSGKRTIPWAGSHGENIPEHSSSVMLFGDPDPGIRGALVDNYICAWRWLAAHDNARGIIDAIREQRAWSLVHYWSDAPLMIPELNWSPYHQKPNPEAFIVHHHGQKKFTDLR